MSQTTDKKVRAVLAVILVILVVVLILLLSVAVRDVRRAKTLEQADMTRSTLSTERRSGPLSKVEVGDIAGWMTFDYVNYLFALPPQYLETTLSINDPAYPHISLNGWARHSNQNRPAVVQAVQSAVAAHTQ